MIEAELHGKSHVAEDRLTSTCLGLLRLLPDSYLLEFLGKAVTLENELLPACSFDLIEEVKFWPYLRDAGEPDATIKLRRNGDPSPLTLIVEAKHGAAKSGFEPTGEEIETAEAVTRNEDLLEVRKLRDQLAKYLRAGRREYQQVALIYLTHHRSMPRQDIDDSLKAAAGDGLIYWLNWFDLYTFTVDRLEGDCSLEFSVQRILDELRKYLEFQGYARFRHWFSLALTSFEDLAKYHRAYGLSTPNGLPGASYRHRYQPPLAVSVTDVLRPLYVRNK